MYDRLLLFGYVLYREFVAASHTRFVKSWYDAVDIIVLTICDDHKRDYKGRWNQPHTFHEEAHKI